MQQAWRRNNPIAWGHPSGTERCRHTQDISQCFSWDQKRICQQLGELPTLLSAALLPLVKSLQMEARLLAAGYSWFQFSNLFFLAAVNAQTFLSRASNVKQNTSETAVQSHPRAAGRGSSVLRECELRRQNSRQGGLTHVECDDFL